MESKIVDFILEANMKAFGTCGLDGINVVPVSSIKIVNDRVWLFDYFMKRTVENLKENPKVSLAVWSGMKGYQLKGDAAYHVDGGLFDKAVEIVWSEFGEDRVLKGLIVISVESIFSVSPGDNSLDNLAL